MSLRKKTLIIVGLTILGLTVILYVVTQHILLSSFAELEEQYTHENVKRVLSALYDEISNLESQNEDYAQWDDTYEFIEDTNKDYIKKNTVDPTFIHLRVNLMLFINSSGKVVFAKAFDLQRKEEIPVTQSFKEHLSPDSLLLQHPSITSIITGIILLPEGPMLVSSCPILTSEGKGPIRGTLIFGRYLNVDEIQMLASTTYLSITIHRFNDLQLPGDFQAVRTFFSEKTPILIRPLDKVTVAGYAQLQDVYRKPILLLRVDMPRDIYMQGKASVSYFIPLLLIISFIFVILTLFLLEKLILSRMHKLNKSVSSIATSGDHSARVSMVGKDELSSLSDRINGMLEALEQSEK